MADLYESQEGITMPALNANAGGKTYTGNQEVDKYINSLPAEERDDAFKKITAPKNGEEIHADMIQADKEKRIYDPTKEDWMKLNDFYRHRESDLFENLSTAAGGIYDQFIKAGNSILDDKEKGMQTLVPSVAEAFAQGTRNMYGMLAQSENSASPQSRFFNAIHGYKENSDAAYREFLQARNFKRDSDALADGSKTMIIDPDHLNNDVVQAASYVADPMWFVPFGKVFSGAGLAMGMGEKIAMASARVSHLNNLVLGNAIKWGVGMPIEFMGKTVRGTIDYGVEKAGAGFESLAGVSRNEFRDTLKMTGIGSIGAGVAGVVNPLEATGYLTAGMTAGRAMAGVGEAIGIIGEQMSYGQRGLASYARQAMIDANKEGIKFSGHAKSLLKIIDAADPLFSYGAEIIKGSTHGAMIGGALGAWSDGEEGLGHGIGAGIALGSIGAGSGRVLGDAFGATRAMRTNIEAKMVIDGLKATHPEQAEQWHNAEIWANQKGFSFDSIIAAKDIVHPRTHIELYGNKGYGEYLTDKGLDPLKHDGTTILPDGDMPLSMAQFQHNNGYVVENTANGMVKIIINADNASRPTLPHEILHSVMRTSVMKDYYIQELRSRIIGERSNEGDLTHNSVVEPAEVKQMFKRYIDAEFSKDKNAHADAIKRLEMATRNFEENGQLISDPTLGGRPLLEHLSEEFGAYYFSHMLMDKPVDWLYHGGDLPGIRGVIEDAGLSWRNYWRSRMNLSHPEFNFNRTFTDSNGTSRLVPIDEVFKPFKGNRVLNPAMDMFFKDMLRIEKNVNETGEFDINKLSASSRKRFIEGNGLDGVFTKQIDGTYRHNTNEQIARENRIKGKAVYKTLMAIPESQRTFTIDAEGSIRGEFSPAIWENLINTGHVTREFANKMQMFQRVISGELKGNVVDFGGIGKTAERAGDVNAPSRVRGSAVPFKSRTVIPFGLDIRIDKNGAFEFKANMLDYKVIEIRANNTWSDPSVKKLWNGNHAEFMTDFYRYLENASKDALLPDGTPNPDRVPSAQLWTDGLGNERRNAMHQVLGLAKGEADTFINTPSGEINRNTLSSVFSFHVNRMTNLRLRNQSVPYKHANAYRDLVRNWSPSEMYSEETPNGRTFSHPSGFKFIQTKHATDAYDDQGKRIGSYATPAEATEAGRKYAIKNPPEVLNTPLMRDNGEVASFSPHEGVGEGWKEWELPKEPAIYKDSIKRWEPYEVSEAGHSTVFDPTYFESIVGRRMASDNGKEGKMASDTFPIAGVHNLWQFFDYYQKKKTAITVRDTLNFINKSGDSIHPNVANDYHSKMAKMMLALADPTQLDLPVHINSGKTWNGGVSGANVGSGFESRITREATARERYAILSKSIDPVEKAEAKKLKDYIDAESKRPKNKQRLDELEIDEEQETGQQKDAKFRHPIIVVFEGKSHSELHLNLEQLIDKAYGATRRQFNSGNYSGSPYTRRVRALTGHSFEGTALEELGHTLFSKIERDAIDANPLLSKIIEPSPADKSGFMGKHWADGVDKFIENTKKRIADGIVLPDGEIYFARILSLQRHLLKNTWVLNEKTGAIESAWTSKGVILNKPTHTDKGKPASNRGSLEKGYVLVSPWEQKGYNVEKDPSGYHLQSPELKSRSVYRLISTPEFQIALFNDPQLIGQWAKMPMQKDIFAGLDAPQVKVGFKPNVDDLAYQASEAISQFTEIKGVPQESILNQIVHEMVRGLDMGRRNNDKDILVTDLMNERGRTKQNNLQTRPEGFLTEGEKKYVEAWRNNMEAWSKANKKPNVLNGLSDWQIWEKTKTGKPFLGHDEAMREPAVWKVNAKDWKTSAVQGYGGFEGIIRKPFDESKNVGVGMWNEDLQKYVKITDENDPSKVPVPETHVPVIDTETNLPEVTEDKKPIFETEDKKLYIIDEDGNKIEIDPETKQPIIDTETKEPVVIPPVIPPVVPPVVPPKVVPKVPPNVVPPVVPPTPAPMPKRDFTKADISIWRSWTTEVYGKGRSFTNAMGYTIINMQNTFRVYNPYKAVIGVYKTEDEAKRRVIKDEPKQR